MTTPHLLVVEDDPASRALLVSYFATEGYRVSEAETGEGLLARLAADPVEVLTCCAAAVYECMPTTLDGVGVPVGPRIAPR